MSIPITIALCPSRTLVWFHAARGFKAHDRFWTAGHVAHPRIRDERRGRADGSARESVDSCWHSCVGGAVWHIQRAMNALAFFDTHAHLDFPDFASEVPEVLSRAKAAGISKIITIGIDLESSKRAVKLAREHPNVYAAIGWHPSY